MSNHKFWKGETWAKSLKEIGEEITARIREYDL